MKAAVAEHTKDVLTTLKNNGIDVEWIQIGNETRTGMLWPLGLVSDNKFDNYAALNNAGYDAAKAVYPDGRHRNVALSGGRQLADCHRRLPQKHLHSRLSL